MHNFIYKSICHKLHYWTGNLGQGVAIHAQWFASIWTFANCPAQICSLQTIRVYDVGLELLKSL